MPYFLIRQTPSKSHISGHSYGLFVCGAEVERVGGCSVRSTGISHKGAVGQNLVTFSAILTHKFGQSNSPSTDAP